MSKIIANMNEGIKAAYATADKAVPLAKTAVKVIIPAATPTLPSPTGNDL